ncbi:hypothetical protein K3495_g9788 [Podosphaera aphanis]|nr:hypothetical protein K3495_g9788 [Podosphaera aphanis]
MKLLEDQGFSKRYVVFKSGPQAGRLIELDAMHPDMIRRYGRHPDILTMDVTFRTNVYNRNLLNAVSATPMNTTLPVSLHLLDGQDKEHLIRHLSWIREQFTSRNIPPLLPVYHDREQALINALKVVFPESAILICEWRINTDIKAKLRQDCGARFHQVRQYDDAGKLSYGDSQDTKDVMKDWFHLIHSQDEDSFNSRLLGFEQKYPYMKAYLDKNWWGYKEYFVYSWTSNLSFPREDIFARRRCP